MTTEQPEPDEPDLSIDPTAPGGDHTDAALNQRVEGAMKKVLAERPVTVKWMTGETGNHINVAMHYAHSSIQMAMMREGLTQEQAKGHAQNQMLLLAFELGRRVGTEIEAARAMTEMFGDLGDGFDLS